MKKFKNPISAEKDIDALVAELAKEGSDAKTVAKLYAKIIAKGVASGVLIGLGIGAAALTIVGIASTVNGEEETETEEDEDSETTSEEDN